MFPPGARLAMSPSLTGSSNSQFFVCRYVKERNAKCHRIKNTRPVIFANPGLSETW